MKTTIGRYNLARKLAEARYRAKSPPPVTFDHRFTKEGRFVRVMERAGGYDFDGVYRYKGYLSGNRRFHQDFIFRDTPSGMHFIDKFPLVTY